ncbi:MULTISPECIES: P-loop NTPase fold protein [unclassified Bradyrhizobium]|uniref:P-loop NTPase fold protein n=1 Tax=unclassified Bradyrhizobium TaxID=2631580 RepID=UPI00339A5BF1
MPEALFAVIKPNFGWPAIDLPAKIQADQRLTVGAIRHCIIASVFLFKSPSGVLMAELGGGNHGQILRDLISVTRLPEIRLSDLASRLLAETVRCLIYKNAYQEELSSTSYVITAFLYLNRNSSNLDGPTDLELSDDEEQSLLRTLNATGLTSRQWRELSFAFFKDVPKVPLDESALGQRIQNVKLGPHFHETFNRLKGNTPITAPSLVGALLSDPESGIAKRVRAIRDPIARTSVTSSAEESPAEPKPASPSERRYQMSGRHVRIVREALLDELGLNAADYAKALATVLRSAEGEFSFALFGKWGSGKTTLLKLLTPLLEDPAEYRRNVAASKSDAYANLHYKVVVHNAWKYRNPPEAWIFLYRSLALAANTSTNALDRWALSSRVAIARWGSFSLVASLAMLALALIPITAKAQLANLVLSALGTSTVIYLVAIWMGAAAKVKQLFHRNLSAVGRDESLGMLALIGDDMRLLLKGWTKADATEGGLWRLAIPLAAVLLVAFIWGIGLSHGHVVDLSSLMVWSGLSTEERTPPLTLADASHWAVLALWVLLSAGLIFLPRYSVRRRPEKVLLVVDDLDRCTPSEMLSVIENVRLLLDDKEINRRMQVLMLVDEGVLNHAIALRYASMITERSRLLGESAAAHDNATADIVAEQIEKLFACYLRLSKLSADDVKQLVTKLAGSENERYRLQYLKTTEMELAEAAEWESSAQKRHNDADKVRLPRRSGQGTQWQRMVQAIATVTRVGKPETEPRKEMAELKKDLSTARLQKEILQNEVSKVRAASTTPAPTAPSDAPFNASDVRFSDAEIEKLRTFVPDYFNAIGRSPSPRSIKALLFKLQLTRLLMQLRFPDLDDGPQRFDALRQAFLDEAKPETGNKFDSFATVVRQVM